MNAPEWTDEDDARAEQLVVIARAICPHEAWAANTLVTAAFGMLAERHGPQDALDTFVSIATDVRRRFRN